MPNFAGKGAPSFGAGLKGLADMLASALRGGVVGTLGGPGDIESAISSGNSHLLPRSEDVDRLLPGTGADKGFKTFEEAGQYIPQNASKIAGKAAALALKGGAAAKALFLPVVASSKPELIARAHAASDMLRQGAGKEEIWKQHQLVQQERGWDPTPQWLSEHAPDSPEMFKREHLLSSDAKKRIHEFYKSRGYRGHTNLSYYEPALDDFLNMTQYPKPNKAIMGEHLLNHPAFDEDWKLGRIPISIYPNKLNDKNLGRYGNATTLGFYNSNATEKAPFGRVMMAGGTLARPDEVDMFPASILEHELQHAVQNRYDLPGGGSPEAPQGTLDELVDRAPDAANYILQNTGHPYAQDLANQLRSYSKKPFDNYQNLIGERQSRLASERLFMPPHMRQKFAPEIEPYKGESATPLSPELYNLLMFQVKEHPEEDLGQVIVDMLGKTP